MRKKPAFAHAQLLGKGPNGEPLETLDRGDVYGARKDGFPSAQATRLVARHNLL